MTFKKPTRSQLAALAAIIAGTGGGYQAAVYQDPGAIGLGAEVTVQLIKAPEAVVTASPMPAKTPQRVSAIKDWREFMDSHGYPVVSGADGKYADEQPRQLLDDFDLLVAELDSPRKPATGWAVHGAVRVAVLSEDGHVKDVRYGPNTLIDAGKDLAIHTLIGATGACTNLGTPCGVEAACAQPLQWNFVGIGESSTMVNPATDTDCLTIPAGMTKQQDTTPSFPSTGQAKVEVTFGSGNPTCSSDCSIVESCLMNKVTSGTMLARQTFGIITKGATDSLLVTWTITIS